MVEEIGADSFEVVAYDTTGNHVSVDLLKGRAGLSRERSRGDSASASFAGTRWLGVHLVGVENQFGPLEIHGPYTLQADPVNLPGGFTELTATYSGTVYEAVVRYRGFGGKVDTFRVKPFEEFYPGVAQRGPAKGNYYALRLYPAAHDDAVKRACLELQTINVIQQSWSSEAARPAAIAWAKRHEGPTQESPVAPAKAATPPSGCEFP